MIDMISYIMGAEEGKKIITLEGNVICTDDGEGNITISTKGRM